MHSLKNSNDSEHKLRANWAADCAAHVLSAFENFYPLQAENLDFGTSHMRKFTPFTV